MEPPDTGASIALGLVAGAMSLRLAFAGRLGSHATPVATVPIPLPGVPRIGRGTTVTGGRDPGHGRGIGIAAFPRRVPGSLHGAGGDGAALVGKYLMTPTNQAVWGEMDEEVRWNKGPPSLAITEHWDYDGAKDFLDGYCWLGQGPLPIEWSGVLTGACKTWGEALPRQMQRYNHQIRLKMVGEMMPELHDTVTPADETDQYGLEIPRITYSWGVNDRASIAHELARMRTNLELVGARDIFLQENDTDRLAGTARMGFDRDSSVVDVDCRSWDVPNLFVCDGSVFPTTGGVNPYLTITTIALRTADRIGAMSKRGNYRKEGLAYVFSASAVISATTSRIAANPVTPGRASRLQWPRSGVARRAVGRSAGRNLRCAGLVSMGGVPAGSNVAKVGKMSVPPLLTIGYEAVRFDAVRDALLEAGTRLVIDVRAIAASRRPGFSKTLLGNGLREAGIDYLHLRPLGTPKDGRDAARRGDIATMQRIFRAHMDGDASRAALAEAQAIAVESRACLLCFERDPAHCHRMLVAEMIVGETGQTITHLHAASDLPEPAR